MTPGRSDTESADSLFDRIGAGGWIRFADFRLDVKERRLLRGDDPVDLSPKAFDVLSFLVGRGGRLASKKSLLEAVWSGVTVSDAVVKVAIGEVRRALDDNVRTPDFIETVQRAGYRFIAEIEPVSSRSGLVASNDLPAKTTAAGGALVGRADALTRLHDKLALAVAGKRQTCFVEGEAGIGKTTLVEAFASDAEGEGLLTVYGQCREHYGEGEAFLPLFEVLGALCRGRDAESILVILRQHCPSWLGQIPWLQSEKERSAVEEQPHRATRRRMLREIAEGFEAIANRYPLVLIFEDLHWSDPSTVDALSALAQRSEAAALLLIGTYRPSEVRQSGHPIRDLRDRVVMSGKGEELTLESLDETEVSDFVRRCLGADAPREVAELLFRRSEGNPLFMTAFLDQLLALHFLAHEDTGWAMRHSMDEIDSLLPERLKGVLDQQIDSLSSEHIRLLECASVVGRDFDSAMISAGLDADPFETEEKLEEIGRQGTILGLVGTLRSRHGPPTGQYSFGHVLLQRAVYARITPSRRADLHARIARELSRREVTPAELAFHFDAAGLADQAIDAWDRAGTLASEQWAMHEAIEHFERALNTLNELPSSDLRDKRRFGLLVKLGSPLTDVFGPGSPRVAEIYKEADVLSSRLEGSVELVPMLAGLFTYRIGRAQHREAERLSVRIMEIVEPLNIDLLRESALLVTGIANLYRGNFEGALASMDLALELSSDEVVYNWGQDARALAYMFSGFAAHVVGRPDDAKTRAASGIRCAALRNDAHLITVTAQFDSILARWQGDTVRARERAVYVDRVSDENGLELWKPVTGWVHGWVRAQEGELDAGVSEMTTHLARYEESGTRASRTDYLAATAEIYCRAGKIDEGLELVDEALDLVERTGERIAEAEVHRVRGLLYLKRAIETAELDAVDRRLGLEALQQAYDVADTQGAVAWRLRAALSLRQFAEDDATSAKLDVIIADIVGDYPTLGQLPEYMRALERINAG